MNKRRHLMLSIATLEKKLSTEQRYVEKNNLTFPQLIKTHPLMFSCIISGLLFIGFKYAQKNKGLWRTLGQTLATRFILAVATRYSVS